MVRGFSADELTLMNAMAMAGGPVMPSDVGRTAGERERLRRAAHRLAADGIAALSRDCGRLVLAPAEDPRML